MLIMLLVFTAYSQQGNEEAEIQFLGVLTLSENYKTATWTEQEMAVVGQHFQRLLQYNEKGKVVFAGRTQYENNHADLMGLVVFYAKNLKDAEQFMNEDPAVKAKLMVAKVHPYTIAIGKQ